MMHARLHAWVFCLYLAECALGRLVEVFWSRTIEQLEQVSDFEIVESYKSKLLLVFGVSVPALYLQTPMHAGGHSSQRCTGTAGSGVG